MVAAASISSAACRVKTTHAVAPSEARPLLEASRDDLISRYNALAGAVRSINAKIEMEPHTGSRYSGVIEDYHRVNGFILAVKPSHIRMIGQAPVVSSRVFDMVSDGQTFRISIPPKGKFIVGPARFERPSKKPLENLRPQHMLEALFWPELEPDTPVLFTEQDQATFRYYVLTVLRPFKAGEPLEVSSRIWFDRADLSLAEIEYFDPAGHLVSQVHYSAWQAEGDLRYPRQILLERPHQDYRLNLQIAGLTLNSEIPADRFELAQPPGSELVRVGEKENGEAGTPKP
jgi:hypothetical protein